MTVSEEPGVDSEVHSIRSLLAAMKVIAFSDPAHELVHHLLEPLIFLFRTQFIIVSSLIEFTFLVNLRFILVDQEVEELVELPTRTNK